MPFTKPTDLPRWATGVAVMSEPSEPVKDTGFVPGTPAEAAHTNWLLNRLYLWMQYLDDPATLAVGGLSVNVGGSIATPAISTTTLTAAGNATVAGPLAVSGAFAAGATTVTGTLGVSGAVSAGGGLTVPVGQAATLQGNATIGGTLGVTGALTARGGITVPVGQAATLHGNAVVGGTLGVAGAATVAGTLGVTGKATVGGLTAAVNQHVTVSGSGDYKHGDRTLQLPASAGIPVNFNGGLSGQPATGATGWQYARSDAVFAQFWYTVASTHEVAFPIPLAVGDRIKSVSARIQDTSGATNTITMYLYKSVALPSFISGSARVGATQTSAGDGTVQTLTVSGLTQTIISFEMYNVTLRANGRTCTTHRVLGVQVTYDRP